MEYLFFRPPRRQPRVLAVTSHANKLTLVASDPWELRYIAENSIPLEKGKRLDKCQVLIQETIVRERPQVLVVLASRSTARIVMKQFAKYFGLPLLEVAPQHWKKFVTILNNGSNEVINTFFKTLPERHVSKALFKNKLLLRTALLAHVALSHLLKKSYDAQPKIELD